MTGLTGNPLTMHKTVLKGVVYKDTGEELEGKEYVKALCPDTPSSLIDDLVQASEKYTWIKTEGFDEYRLFREEYAHIQNVATRERGLVAFYLYERYRLIVEAAVLKETNFGDVTGDFLGNRAREGSDQWIIRQICTDSVDIVAGDRTFTTGGTSVTPGFYPFHIVPRVAVGSDVTYYTTDNDKQMLLIFYYQSDLGPRVLESVSEKINDSIGWRTPFDVYSQLQRGNEGITTRPGCLVVDHNKRLDINAWCLENDETDIMPQGIDINTRMQIRELNST
jgi:hypothetical protein